MKKFQYKMESIFQIKTKLEDQAKLVYGNAKAKLMTEEEKMLLMQRKATAYENELRCLRSDRLDLLKIRQCEQAIDVLKMNIKQQATIIKNAAHRVEVARIRLNDAMVDRKTQEKLKELALEEFMYEYELEERKEADERNSFNYSNPAFHKEDI